MAICTPWRVGASLNKLLDQINAAAPARSKASDGSIGDSAHQAQGACASQHNSCCIRYNGVWIVRARDFTHDPAHGADMRVIAEQLRLSRDPRIRYIIFNRRITGPGYGWEWHPYDGDNPHDKHLHVSVFDDAARFDDTSPWTIAPQEEDMTPDQAMQLAQTWTMLRQLYWMWPADRKAFVAAGGDPAIWDYAGGLGDGNKMTRDLIAGFTKLGEGLTVVSQKLDELVAAGGGLTPEDRALLQSTLDAVTALNSRLATP